MPRPSRAYWICQAFGWSFYLVFTTIQGAGDGLGTSLLLTSIATVSGVTLTHGGRHLLLRWKWLALGAAALAPRMVAASVAVAIVHVSIVGCIEARLLPPQEASWLVIALFAVMRWSMVFFIWFAIYCGYRLMEQRREGELRAVQAEKALKDAELRALRAQLNPHFLFNALNSIRALVAGEPALAQDAITRIARILRYSLATDHEQTVTLGSELDIVEDYLALEGLRLAERLVVERTISDEARAARIPILLLQLLVENALKHGIAQLPGGGVLRIKAAIAEGVLELEVENPRPKRSDVADSTGVGLSNAEGRLRILFGGEATLKLDLSSPSTAIACARVPTGYDAKG